MITSKSELYKMLHDKWSADPSTIVRVSPEEAALAVEMLKPYMDYISIGTELWRLTVLDINAQEKGLMIEKDISGTLYVIQQVESPVIIPVYVVYYNDPTVTSPGCTPAILGIFCDETKAKNFAKGKGSWGADGNVVPEWAAKVGSRYFLLKGRNPRFVEA